MHRWTISRAGMSVTVPDDRPLELGRHAETTARLFADTTNVSRRHAIVCAVEQGLEVTDQQSSNGTFVNGRRCTPFAPHPLGEGDELRLAMDVILGVTCG
ncbi:MAG: FHA domain-containing protein [Chloroflexi bacterium]|nr:FHA domain-containing protein [Chloroflexota bacterium]